MAKKGGSVKDPFVGGDRPFADTLRNQLGTLFPNSFTSTNLSGAFGANPLESFAGSGLMSLDPLSQGSYMAGSSGGMNPGAGRPAGGDGASQPNALDILKKTAAGGFADPTQNPFYSALSGSATDAAQRFLNQQFDVIGSDLNKAGGGVATSSALPEQKTRAAENVSSQLGGTLADIQSRIYGQERGLQEGAVGSALDLALKRFGGLEQLGTLLQSRTEAGLQFPLDEALKYLSVVRGVPVQGSGNPFAQALTGAGSLLGGIGSLGQGFG